MFKWGFLFDKTGTISRRAFAELIPVQHAGVSLF